MEPDGFSFLGHDHHVILILYQADTDDRTVAVGRLDGNDALAAAGLAPVLGNGRPLTIAVLARGQERDVLFGFRVHDFKTDDLVPIVEFNAAHARSRPAHGADFVFGEPDGHATPRRK